MVMLKDVNVGDAEGSFCVQEVDTQLAVSRRKSIDGW